MSTRQNQLLKIFAILCVLVVVMAGPVAGKSVYLSANHHTRQFDAWNIGSNGLISYQATYTLNHSLEPAGIAIDAVTGFDPVTGDPLPSLMFVTSEGYSGGVEVINPVTLEFYGVAPGPINMGGVDVDDIDNIMYAIQRGTSGYGGSGTSELYIYSYNDDGSGITQLAHITLPNHGYGMGLALDDSRNILWVGDIQYNMVKAYDVNVSDWNDIVEVPALSFSVSHSPIDVAVDSKRNLVYTVAGWVGSTLLTKYDVAASVETTVDLGSYGGIGCAVDEISGYIYLTRGPYGGDDVQVWDCSTSPFTLLQDTPDLGNPAGIAIGNVGYNPPNLAKNDAVVGYGVYIGQTFTYEITFTNNDSLFDMTNVTIIDNMPPELDFVSETVDSVPGTGIYDPPTHTVTWNIGTVPAGQAGPFIELVVKVNQSATPDTTIYNYCTIISDQFDSITVIGEDPDDTTGDPGTPILPSIPVDFDIKPQSCPNPVRVKAPDAGLHEDNTESIAASIAPVKPLKATAVLPVAILGTVEFDIADIDPATVMLEGVPPLHWSVEDVATPVGDGAAECECTTLGPDGYTDLTLKFEKDLIVQTLGSVNNGDVIALTITGELYDGTPIVGSDCILIRKAKISYASEPVLNGNYPNPFNPVTEISFNLTVATDVTLEVYNVTGQKVATLIRSKLEAGNHTVTWDGSNVASGVYLYRLEAGDYSESRKMILLK